MVATADDPPVKPKAIPIKSLSKEQFDKLQDIELSSFFLSYLVDIGTLTGSSTPMTPCVKAENDLMLLNGIIEM